MEPQKHGSWLAKNRKDLGVQVLFGDPGIASAIQKDKVGIGMNNIGYVYDQKTKRPYDGLAVLPLDINDDGKITPDEDFYGDINHDESYSMEYFPHLLPVILSGIQRITTKRGCQRILTLYLTDGASSM